MAQLVNQEEATSTIHLTANDAFLSTLLFVEAADVTATRRELDTMKHHGIDDLLEFGFDEEEFRPPDKPLYKPFVDAANSIIACSPQGLAVHWYWATQGDEVPQCTDEMFPRVRPEVACVLGDQRFYFRALEMLDTLSESLKDESEPFSTEAFEELLKVVYDYAMVHLGYRKNKTTTDEIEVEQMTQYLDEILVTLNDREKDRMKKYQRDDMVELLDRMRKVINAIYGASSLEISNRQLRTVSAGPNSAEHSQLEKLVSKW